MRALLGRVNFELPETAVAQETRNVVYDLVRENAQRGVSREVIEKQKEQIYSAATHNAKERVKVAVPAAEDRREGRHQGVAGGDRAAACSYLAAMYQIPPEKFLKDLQKRNGLIEIYDQIMNEKVIDFLEKNAKYEDVAADASAVNPT